MAENSKEAAERVKTLAERVKEVAERVKEVGSSHSIEQTKILDSKNPVRF